MGFALTQKTVGAFRHLGTTQGQRNRRHQDLHRFKKKQLEQMTAEVEHAMRADDMSETDKIALSKKLSDQIHVNRGSIAYILSHGFAEAFPGYTHAPLIPHSLEETIYINLYKSFLERYQDLYKRAPNPILERLNTAVIPKPD